MAKKVNPRIVGTGKSLGAQLVARRYAKQSPQERSAAARHAAQVRWSRRQVVADAPATTKR